jgi:hypothetical protein
MDRPMLLGDVTLVSSATGSIVHLVESKVLHLDAEPRTICGRRASVRTLTPFELNGCVKCCERALKAGLEHVVDVYGDTIELRQVLADSSWRL